MSDEPRDGSPGKEEDEELRRQMSHAPGAIMRQSRLLVALAGVLIGFLLNISATSLSTLSPASHLTLTIAIFSATVAVNLFLMPSIFFHIPSRLINFKIFVKSSQRFIFYGMIAVSITLYLCLEVALSAFLGIEGAFGVAAVPFVLAYSMFLAEVRKMKNRFKK
jgi:hypothetical protein